MTSRYAVLCTLLAAVVAGAFFAPVFGLTPLLAPLLVPAALLFGVAELCTRRAALAAWRPLLLLVAGLVGVVETTLFATTAAGFPTGATFSALAAGVTDSWQLTLQSTWPARPDAPQLLFVPLLALLAGVSGVELLLRSRKPLPALLPSLAIVVLSQFFAAFSGVSAVLAGLAYAGVAGALCLAGRDSGSGVKPAFALGLPVVALGLVAAVLAGVVLPSPPAAYSLKRDQNAQIDARVISPLDEIANRLQHPGAQVFSVRGDRPDRWPLVVFDDFDGVNWTPGDHYRRLGTKLAVDAEVAVPVHERTATITLAGSGGPWLPSQTWPAAVSGAAPLVEESQGTLWQPGGAGEYTLNWWEPQVPVADLMNAAIDPHAPGGLDGVGAVPADVEALARTAAGGLSPSFRAALALERFFRDGYREAAGASLPSGNGWPQLKKFLLETRRGTSEQFAAAYVALARVNGIPARLVVGYRSPAPDPTGAYLVRNNDVLAWPEVAVDGVGWVPLDPTPAVQQGGTAGRAGLSQVTELARRQLPPIPQLSDPAQAAGSDKREDDASRSERWSFLLVPVLLVLVLCLLAGIIGIPVAKAIRTAVRRRRPGAAAVLGACHEVHDRLRDHRIPCTAGMTVRDLAAAADGISHPSTVDGLRALAVVVDRALWSGTGGGEHAGPQAWAAVHTVRRGLARRGARARVQAAFDPRTLNPFRPRPKPPRTRTTRSESEFSGPVSGVR